ncbi:MAG: terminase small subunit [Acidaminococcales bacterium]|nr:terminase small subunit [Acidaminococcales bacterium]
MTDCLAGPPQRAHDGKDGLIAGEAGVLMVVTEILRNEEANIRDRLKAAELLGKHLGLFADKSDLSGAEAFADELMKARERIKDAR